MKHPAGIPCCFYQTYNGPCEVITWLPILQMRD